MKKFKPFIFGAVFGIVVTILTYLLQNNALVFLLIPTMIILQPVYLIANFSPDELSFSIYGQAIIMIAAALSYGLIFLGIQKAFSFLKSLLSNQ